MFQWNEQGHEAFVQRMSFSAELHQAGVEGEALLSRLYCAFLPDTAEQQGDWMARHVLERIRLFDETRENLLNLEDKPEAEQKTLLGEDILDLMEGFTLPSQCRKLQSINQGMDAFHALCQGTCIPEEVTQKVPAGYRGNTGEAGRDAGLKAVVEKLLAPDLAACAQGEAEVYLSVLWQEWMDDDIYRAILTISLYTMLVNGEGAKLPGELPVSVEYIAMEVCRLVSAREGKEKQEVPEAAQRRRAVDSAAVKIFLAAGFLAGGTATVMLATSAVAVYAAYYLTTLAVGGLIISAAAEPDMRTVSQRSVNQENATSGAEQIRTDSTISDDMEEDSIRDTAPNRNT